MCSTGGSGDSKLRTPRRDSLPGAAALRAAIVVAGAALALGCRNQDARAPSPPTYRWPQDFAYKVDFVSDAQANGHVVLHYAESRVTHFAVREDESYLVTHDSILRTSNVPGGPLQLVGNDPDDTLAWFLRVGPLGELRDMQLGCDPDVPQCRAVLPSSLPFELRRIIPRLSPWPVPRGSAWVDTLTYNDSGRPGGTRGQVVTRYHVQRDTVVAGRACWMVAWESVRQSYEASADGNLREEPPVQENGVTFVDMHRLMPVFSMWAGVAMAGPLMRSAGATEAGYRGRAYLEGSVFDSLVNRK